KELPSKLARTADEHAEERRLLYVGMTRARRWLALTWSRRPSPLLAELGVDAPRAASLAGARAADRPERDRSPEAEVLRRWPLERARSDGVPPYVIFPDRTIAEILARRPSGQAELAAIHGLGPARLARFGRELSEVVGEVLAGNAAETRPREESPKRAPAHAAE